MEPRGAAAGQALASLGLPASRRATFLGVDDVGEDEGYRGVQDRSSKSFNMRPSSLLHQFVKRSRRLSLISG